MVELPEGVMYLWNMFASIYSGTKISYQEIKAYCDLMQADLRPFEVEAIVKLSKIMGS